MEPSCPLGTTRCIPQEKFPWKPHNKSFIDQVCLVKMAGYWPRSFFVSLWTSALSRSINMQKKELGQYPAILASHLVNRPILCLCKWSRTGGQNNNKKWCLAPKGSNFLSFVLQLRYIFMDMKRVYNPYILNSLSLFWLAKSVQWIFRISTCDFI